MSGWWPMCGTGRRTWRSRANTNRNGIVTDQTDLRTNRCLSLRRARLPGIGLTKAELFTNKYRMRQFLRQRGYPTPEYRLCQSPADAADLREVWLSDVLKPPANQGSRGVFVVRTGLGTAESIR